MAINSSHKLVCVLHCWQTSSTPNKDAQGDPAGKVLTLAPVRGPPGSALPLLEILLQHPESASVSRFLWWLTAVAPVGRPKSEISPKSPATLRVKVYGAADY